MTFKAKFDLAKIDIPLMVPSKYIQRVAFVLLSISSSAVWLLLAMLICPTCKSLHPFVSIALIYHREMSNDMLVRFTSICGCRSGYVGGWESDSLPTSNCDDDHHQHSDDDETQVEGGGAGGVQSLDLRDK